MFVIVPNELDAEINAKLDQAIQACPDAAKDRKELYRQLLSYYTENGELPGFTLVKKG